MSGIGKWLTPDRIVGVVGRRIKLERKAAASLLLIVLGLLMVGLHVWPAYAAIELAYYRATAYPNSILLEWATLREYNVEGYEILCKRENELPISYHTIGSRIAQGGPDLGAQYSFNVTTGLFPGETYCFRLQERTTDGTPGEQFDLCGYGLGISPTPTLSTTVPFDAINLTPTAIVVTPPPDVTFTPTLPPTPTSFESPLSQSSGADEFTEPTPGLDFVTETPTVTPTMTETPTETPTLFQPESPISVIPQETPDPAALAANASPLPQPVIPPVTAPTEAPLPEDVAPTPTVEIPFVPETPTPEFDPNAVAAAPTPTPIYLVVTATPTEQAVVLAPTFTPWPTVTPTPALGLLAFLTPNTQNMMVMLLCLIFVTAGGLGTLGLVTVVVWMRSQAQRERVLDRLYRRRL